MPRKRRIPAPHFLAASAYTAIMVWGGKVMVELYQDLDDYPDGEPAQYLVITPDLARRLADELLHAADRIEKKEASIG